MSETPPIPISDAAVEAVKRYRESVVEFQKYWSAYKDGANSLSESIRVGYDMEKSERELIVRIESIAAEVRRQVFMELIAEAKDADIGTRLGNKYIGVKSLADWLREQGESK